MRIDDRTTVSIPPGWHVAAYRGELATVYFPLRFVSTRRFTGPCALRVANSGRCSTHKWFPRGWLTPADGAVVLWSHAEFPTAIREQLGRMPGHRVVIDHRTAVLQSSSAKPDCPPGARSELRASVAEDPRLRFDDRYDLLACFGPHATVRDRHQVRQMLLSLRITR